MKTNYQIIGTAALDANTTGAWKQGAIIEFPGLSNEERFEQETDETLGSSSKLFESLKYGSARGQSFNLFNRKQVTVTTFILVLISFGSLGLI